jgi:hypothetical protein
MGYEESYAKASPLGKLALGMLDPEMIDHQAKIVNEAVKDGLQVNILINDLAGGNTLPLAAGVADRLHSGKPRQLF